MKVLVVGSGGREHCLAWKIKQSSRVRQLYIAPGNGGTALLGHNVDIKADDIDSLVEFAKGKSIDLTVVGPEAPLVAGIVDRFQEAGLKVFGPNQELANLEGSKVFAKEMLKKYHIPTADFEVFVDATSAKDYIKTRTPPLVVKADGLAAGKGVIVCKTHKEAKSTIDLIMVEKKFGQAGNKVIVEDFLEGEEVSILVFTDSESIVPLVTSQDHKRVFDDDQGPNTGGMGAYAPTPLVNEVIFYKIIKEVFRPLITGLKQEGKLYKGMLYAGLMIKDNRPFVLEFNVRFGDPETQAILPKLKSDLVEVMLKTIDKKLSGTKLEWDERFCLCVVLASGGYPGSYQKQKEITGLEAVKDLNDIFVFHAGTRMETTPKMRFLTNGGRVLGIVSLGKDLQEAQDKVYKAIEKIYFEGMHYRKDIGNKARKYLTISS